VDEDALSLLQGTRRFDAVVGGEALQGDGGGLVEVEAFGDGDQVSCRGHGVLGVPARAEQGDRPVADRDVLDTLPHLGNGACDLRSRDEGKILRHHVLVAATHGVRVVYAGGANLDQGLPLARRRALSVRVPENLGLAELFDEYGFHLRHLTPVFCVAPALAEGWHAGDGVAEDEGVDLVGALVGPHALQVAHVPHGG
jgi:hypothetical protein